MEISKVFILAHHGWHHLFGMYRLFWWLEAVHSWIGSQLYRVKIKLNAADTWKCWCSCWIELVAVRTCCEGSVQEAFALFFCGHFQNYHLKRLPSARALGLLYLAYSRTCWLLPIPVARTSCELSGIYQRQCCRTFKKKYLGALQRALSWPRPSCGAGCIIRMVIWDAAAILWAQLSRSLWQTHNGAWKRKHMLCLSIELLEKVSAQHFLSRKTLIRDSTTFFVVILPVFCRQTHIQMSLHWTGMNYRKLRTPMHPEPGEPLLGDLLKHKSTLKYPCYLIFA